MLTFGIDAGAKSIGWAVIDTVKQAIIATGARIFSDGRSAKTHETMASKRRQARLIRRQTNRRKSRMKATMRLIQSHIFTDFDPNLRTSIGGRFVRPDEARSRLLIESPESVGGIRNLHMMAAIAIYNIAGYRGFKSNLKTPPAYDDRNESRGQEMWRLRKSGMGSRLTKTGVANATDPRPKRIHIENEFNAIWDSLRSHSDVFTDELRQAFHDVIFFQRPLQDGNRGRCAYMPNEVRAWSHEEDYQRFVIRKSLADIRYVTGTGESGKLSDRPRIMDNVVAIAWDKGITWKAIEKHLRAVLGNDAMLFNVEGQAAEGRKKIGPAKIDETEDDEGNSTKTTGNISLVAARLIHDRMVKDECGEYDAVVSLASERDDFELGAKLDKIEDANEMLDFKAVEDLIGEITDPSVRVIYGQIQSVVNELVRRFGRPDMVALESAREVARGKEAYAKEQVKRKDNRQANEHRGTKSMFARLTELYGSDCFFCGERPAEDKEHLIPFALDGDNNFHNQVPSCPACNHEKGNQTPFQAFYGKPQWSNITDRLNALKKSDRRTYSRIHWRFGESALDNIEDGFHPRDLHSLRYAEKIIRYGIAPITKSPKIVRGLTTSRGRRHYRLTKDRTDHRHHARDAIVIALAPRNVRHDWFPNWINGADIEKAVDSAIVSHRCDRSKVGALHDETAIKWSEQKNSHIEFGSGQHRKVARPNGNWAVEIYRKPDGECVGKTITRFDANRPGFRAGVSARPHPCAKLVMRLHTNDTVEVNTDTGKVLMRVKKLQNDSVMLVETNDARTDWWIDNEDGTKTRKSSGSLYSVKKLFESSARKVDISPTGLYHRNRQEIDQ